MTSHDGSRLTRERGLRAALAVLGLAGAALLVVAAVRLASQTSSDPAGAPEPPARASAATTSPAPAAAPPSPARTKPRRSPGIPARVEIPAAGVRARVIRLGLHRDGTLEVPSDPAETGWWSGGSRPGEPGPAVIVGHVDSRTGPAVFFRLERLRGGDVVRVADRRGAVMRFAVRRVKRYRKSRFPTAAVYGTTSAPTLRLITCSGDFDRATGHYVDNTVVFATLVSRG